ncbi:MAG: hypothetical protein SynsKO_16530 [Synoicihabitans sp.]
MSDLVLLLAGLSAGIAITLLGRKTRRGRELAGVMLEYEDGRKIRDLSATELIGFVVMIFSLGGLCIWTLFHHFEV